MIFSWHVSLGFSWLEQFLELPLSLMTLTVLRIMVRYTGGSLSTGIFFNISLMFRLGLWVWGERDHRGKVPFSSQHLKSTYYDFGVDLNHPARWCSVFGSFLHWKVILPPRPAPFTHCSFWKEITVCRSNHPSGWSTYINYLETFHTCPSFVNVFDHFFVSVQAHGHLFHSWSYNPILY